MPIVDPIVDSSVETDGVSVFFDDDHSSRTSQSIDFEKVIPRRGSLKPEPRKAYREHHRQAYPQYERRLSREAVDLIPERTYKTPRPPVNRRRSYVPARAEITYGEEGLSPRSYRSYSPNDFDRTERDIEALERELHLEDKREKMYREERGLDREVQRRKYKYELEDELERRRMGRDRGRDRYLREYHS